MSSRSGHWSVQEEEFDTTDYGYPRTTRYTSSYTTPQRYVSSISDSYIPSVRQSSKMVTLPPVSTHVHGKSYTRSIPHVAHQRLSSVTAPPRSYTSVYDPDEKILGYRVPPSSHVVTATTYRPWIEEEVDYYTPPPRVYSWTHTVPVPSRRRWRSMLDDEDDYTVEDPVVVRSGFHYKNVPLPKPMFSYADRYASDIYNDSTSIVPTSYYLGHKPHVPVHVNKGYHYTMPKYKGTNPSDYYEDSSHATKYVVVPLRDVHSNIYNMSFYRKPMTAANIGSGHLACLRFAGSQFVLPTRPQRSYGLDTIPQHVQDSKSLYGGMIAAVRDHRLVRVSIYPIHWKDDEGSYKKDRVIEISSPPSKPWKFMGSHRIRREPRIVEIADTTTGTPKRPLRKKEVETVKEGEEKPAEPKPSSPKEPTPPPPKEPTPPPAKEPTPPPPKEPTPPPKEPTPPPKEPTPPPKVEPEVKKKKKSKGAAAEPAKEQKPEPPKEEPKPEPPKEEPKPEPPKEESKPEPPKEEPKPEPPKEPKPEPPKEESKSEPPKEEAKPELSKEEPTPPTPEPPKDKPTPPTPEPPKEEPTPPTPEPVKEEPKPESTSVECPAEQAKSELPKEEPKLEPTKEVKTEPVAQESESIVEPETPGTEAVKRKGAFDEDPGWLQSETEGERPTTNLEEPVMESTLISNVNQHSTEEPKPAEEEPPKEAAVEEEAVDPASAAAERRKSVFEEDPSWLKADEETSKETTSGDDQPPPAATRKGAFDEEPGWLDETEEKSEPPTPGTTAVLRKGAFDEDPGWLDQGEPETPKSVPQTPEPVPETPGTQAVRRKGAFDEDPSWLDEGSDGDAAQNVSIVVADPEGGKLTSGASQPSTDSTTSPSDARVAQIQESSEDFEWGE